MQDIFSPIPVDAVSHVYKFSSSELQTCLTDRAAWSRDFEGLRLNPRAEAQCTISV